MKLCFGEYGGEVKQVDINTGLVERHYKDGTVYKASEQWKVTGISILNNFGKCTDYLSLNEFAELMKTNKEKLFYKNGKAKFRVNDLDHGSCRQWGKVYQRFEVFTK